MTGEELLRHHVANFNAGVHSGDWSPMVESFTPDATMEFVGIPIGPFQGRDAIAAAYVERPPDDELVLLAVESEDDAEVVLGRYAWASDPAMDAGGLELERDGDLIRRLVVHYGE
jgi:steroid delta-isomerase